MVVSGTGGIMITADFIELAQQHLGRVVQAPSGNTYDDLVRSWDAEDGPVPEKSALESIRERVETGLKWDIIRSQRNRLLKSSDFTQVPDIPFNDDTKAAWAKYRQDLRDITKQADPENVTWPTEP